MLPEPERDGKPKNTDIYTPYVFETKPTFTATGNLTGAAPDAAPAPGGANPAAEPAPGAVDPAVDWVEARKRAREELIDSMTRDWTADEVAALLARKRRVV
jgi:hypothetical protein